MLPEDQRVPTLLRLVRDGEAIGLACRLAYSINRMHQADAVQRDSVFQEFAAATVEQLRGIVVARVRDVARTNGLAHLPDVYLVLQIWSAWTDVADVQQWFNRSMENNEVRLLVESVQVGTSYTHG